MNATPSDVGACLLLTTSLLLTAYQVESARLHTKLDAVRSDLRSVVEAFKKKKKG